MLAALIIQANTPTVDPYFYLRSGGALSEEEDEKYEYQGYFDPSTEESRVTWELGLDGFSKEVSFEAFALKAARIGYEKKELDDMKLALEVIEKRKQLDARLKVLRNGALIGVGTYALWRLFMFL